MSKPQFSCSVQVQVLPEHTNAAQGQFAYSYTVTIENSGDITAQLVARHWHIVDAHGDSQEVRGLAVVGNQPVLKPGDKFQYSSWTQLATKQGSMRGQFLCVSEEAEVFYAEVAEFMLTDPASLH